MRRKFLVLSTALLSLSLMAGCSQHKHKQEAYDAWNAARAAAQGSLATERYKLGNLDDARKAVDEAVKLDPKNPAYLILSARIHIEKNELEPADQELATARKLAPKNGEVDYLSGVIYQRWVKPELALEYYSQACEKGPGELHFLMARAEMLVQLNRLNEAAVLIEGKLTYFEYSGPLRDELGGIYLQQGRLKEAIEMLHQASILASDDLSIRDHLAYAYFRGGKYRDCVSEINPLLKDKNFEKRADLYMIKGESHLQLGEPGDARSALETSLEMSPTSVGALVSLAKVAIRGNDLDRAELCLKKALALKEDDAQIHLGIGYLRLKQNRLGEASAAFEKSAQLNPKDPVAICMIGLVLEKQGKGDEAMQCYGKALQLNPNDKLAKTLMSNAK